jgi:hypothetical protein
MKPTNHPKAENTRPTAFDMRRLAPLFADGLVGGRGEDFLVGGPEVAEAVAGAIGGRDLVPQAATRGVAAITDDEGDDLPGAPT